MLEAREFTIYTDHKPLIFAFHTRKSNCSPRQYRHLDFISQFSTDIQHISVKDNIVADTLSRIEELESPVDHGSLAKAQEADSELENWINDGTSLRLAKMKIPGSRLELFKHVHIDLIGPLPVSNGYRYCLTAVDRFSRWPEAIPITDITAETVAKAFIEVRIARFGCPTIIVTDRGRQFESALFTYLSQRIGFQHRRTTAACNGLVERFHRQLKAAIVCHARSNWTESLQHKYKIAAFLVAKRLTQLILTF
ncbi:hypothetical protein ABMA27_010296 [Loxostege sticticalis]|uniref:Integrase catalytic domain-containing protein n=1 Tax=Loxostege sticticalis TaxID=481309 RepID=A0ABR3H5K8_LOXSC